MSQVQVQPDKSRWAQMHSNRPRWVQISSEPEALKQAQLPSGEFRWTQIRTVNLAQMSPSTLRLR